MDNDSLLGFLLDGLSESGRTEMPDAMAESTAAAPDAMPLRLVDGVAVPDYGAWCGGWWKDCFTCPEYMADKLRFCRKWNRTFYGEEIL